MISSQIKKIIKNILINNYSGKEFYNVEFKNYVCANKFLGNNINLYKLNVTPSGLTNFKDLLKFEIKTKVNSYSKTEINVDIKLFNSDNTVITNLYFSVNKSSEESIVEIATSKINEAFDKNYVYNYVKEANDQYYQTSICDIKNKLENYEEQSKKITTSTLDLKQLTILIEYYSDLILYVNNFYSK